MCPRGRDPDPRRAAAFEAARQVLSELEARGGYCDDDLEELRIHYRRMDGRTRCP